MKDQKIKAKKAVRRLARNMATVLLLTASTLWALTPAKTELEFSTYFGGSNGQFVRRMAGDRQGNIAISGYTYSDDFPMINPIQSFPPGGSDKAFISLFNSQGEPLFSSWFGGSGHTTVTGLALDAQGNILLCGTTASPDFPLKGSRRTAVQQSEIFITRLSPDGGTILNSVILGGSLLDSGEYLTLNSRGDIFISASSTSPDFPAPGANPGYLSMIIAISPDFSQINPIPLPLTSQHFIFDIAADQQGGIYIGGFTKEMDLPVFRAFQPNRKTARRWEGFLMKISGRNHKVEYATFLSGSEGSRILSVAVDDDGCAWVSGDTGSVDFPIAHGLPPENEDGFWGFIARFSPLGDQLLFSSMIAPTGCACCRDILIGDNGSIYAAGEIMSESLPTAFPFQSRPGGDMGLLDSFVLRLSPDGRERIFSSYLGGESADSGIAISAGPGESVCVAGDSYSPDFPVQNAYMPVMPNEERGYVTLTKFLPANIPLKITSRMASDKAWLFSPRCCSISLTINPSDLELHQITELRFYKKIIGGDYRLFHIVDASHVRQAMTAEGSYTVIDGISPAERGRAKAWFVIAVNRDGKAAGLSPTTRLTIPPGGY